MANTKISGLTAATTPVDADIMPLVLSPFASGDNRKITWANIKATLWTAWGALIAAGTGKTTPVDADMFAIADSAASNATKKLTLANLRANLFGVTANLTVGFTSTALDEGAKSSGTFTLDAATGAIKRCVNGGAFTLAPPSADSTVILHITNNGSAGAITTSGFTKVKGDAFTTTNAHEFMCSIIKCNSKSVLNVVALQ